MIDCLKDDRITSYLPTPTPALEISRRVAQKICIILRVVIYLNHVIQNNVIHKKNTLVF